MPTLRRWFSEVWGPGNRALIAGGRACQISGVDKSKGGRRLVAGTKLPLSLAWIASAAAVILAVFAGLQSLWMYRLWGLYDPSVAVLTATLIAVIWYSYFTFKSVQQVKDIREEEQKSKIRQLGASLLTIRAQLSCVQVQLGTWHEPDSEPPIELFALRYIDAELADLDRQIISLEGLASRVPAESQANVHAVLVHLRTIRPNLQLWIYLLSEPEGRVNSQKLSNRVIEIVSDLDIAMQCLQEAFSTLPDKDATEYFGSYSEVLRKSRDAIFSR